MDITPEQTPDSASTGSTGFTAGTGTAGTGPAGTGTAGGQAPSGPAEERLHRVARGRMLGGVAAGAADYFDVDPTVIRIGFVALALLGGLAVPLYLAGWLLIPDEGSDTSVAEELLDRHHAHHAPSAF